MNPAGGRYTRRTVKNIQVVNILAGISWIFLIYLLNFTDNDSIGWVLLAIPLIIFYVNFSNAPKGSAELEGLQYRGDYLAFASITMLVLIHWAKVEGQEKKEFYKIILTAFILLMLSLIYVWPSGENNSLQLHSRSILQTSGLVLLAYALYRYYVIHTNLKNNENEADNIYSKNENSDIYASLLATTGT